MVKLFWCYLLLIYVSSLLVCLLALKTVYVPGETAFPFSVPLVDGSLLSYQYDTKAKSHFLPLIIWATDFANDAWSQAALTWDYSVDMFLTSYFNADNATYLFIAKKDITDLLSIQSKIFIRANALGINLNSLDRILYSNYTLSSTTLKTTASALIDNLNQWTSSTTRINVFYPSPQNSSISFVYNISRLDCYWPNCGTSFPSSAYLVNAGDACRNISTSIKGKVVLVTANTCSYVRAALNVYAHGGIAILLIMKQSEEVPIIQINTAGEVYVPIFVTSISYSDGLQLQQLLAATSSAAGIRVQLYSQAVSGNFLVVDGNGQLQEMGSAVNADLRIASWAAQYEVYQQRLSRDLSEGAFVVPLFSGRILSALSAPVTVPRQILLQYSEMEIETVITCPGQADSDCSAWDHSISISFRCAFQSSSDSDSDGDNYKALKELESKQAELSRPLLQSHLLQAAGLPHRERAVQGRERRLEAGGDAFELARYVTPFRRRNGHWLTDISPSIALLAASDCASSSFIFEATAGGYPWFLSSNLRFSDPYPAADPDLTSDSFFNTDSKLICAQKNLVLFAYFLLTGTEDGSKKGPGRPPENGLDGTEDESAESPPTLRPSNYTTLYHFSEFFTTAYNSERSAITFRPPPRSQRVLLEALITGHGQDASTGCCEFLPSVHIFTVNGMEFNLTFSDAGTWWGCADKAIEGSEPNEYGTWWYGRAGHFHSFH